MEMEHNAFWICLIFAFKILMTAASYNLNFGQVDIRVSSNNKILSNAQNVFLHRRPMHNQPSRLGAKKAQKLSQPQYPNEFFRYHPKQTLAESFNFIGEDPENPDFHLMRNSEKQKMIESPDTIISDKVTYPLNQRSHIVMSGNILSVAEHPNDRYASDASGLAKLKRNKKGEMTEDENVIIRNNYMNSLSPGPPEKSDSFSKATSKGRSSPNLLFTNGLESKREKLKEITKEKENLKAQSGFRGKSNTYDRNIGANNKKRSKIVLRNAKENKEVRKNKQYDHVIIQHPAHAKDDHALPVHEHVQNPIIELKPYDFTYTGIKTKMSSEQVTQRLTTSPDDDTDIKIEPEQYTNPETQDNREKINGKPRSMQSKRKTHTRKQKGEEVRMTQTKEDPSSIVSVNNAGGSKTNRTTEKAVKTPGSSEKPYMSSVVSERIHDMHQKTYPFPYQLEYIDQSPAVKRKLRKRNKQKDRLKMESFSIDNMIAIPLNELKMHNIQTKTAMKPKVATDTNTSIMSHSMGHLNMSSLPIRSTNMNKANVAKEGKNNGIDMNMSVDDNSSTSGILTSKTYVIDFSEVQLSSSTVSTEERSFLTSESATRSTLFEEQRDTMESKNHSSNQRIESISVATVTPVEMTEIKMPDFDSNNKTNTMYTSGVISVSKSMTSNMLSAISTVPTINGTESILETRSSYTDSEVKASSYTNVTPFLPKLIETSMSNATTVHAIKESITVGQAVDKSISTKSMKLSSIFPTPVFTLQATSSIHIDKTNISMVTDRITSSDILESPLQSQVYSGVKSLIEVEHDNSSDNITIDKANRTVYMIPDQQTHSNESLGMLQNETTFDKPTEINVKRKMYPQIPNLAKGHNVSSILKNDHFVTPPIIVVNYNGEKLSNGKSNVPYTNQPYSVDHTDLSNLSSSEFESSNGSVRASAFDSKENEIKVKVPLDARHKHFHKIKDKIQKPLSPNPLVEWLANKAKKSWRTPLERKSSSQNNIPELLHTNRSPQYNGHSRHEEFSRMVLKSKKLFSSNANKNTSCRDNFNKEDVMLLAANVLRLLLSNIKLQQTLQQVQRQKSEASQRYLLIPVDQVQGYVTGIHNNEYVFGSDKKLHARQFYKVNNRIKRRNLSQKKAKRPHFSSFGKRAYMPNSALNTLNIHFKKKRRHDIQSSVHEPIATNPLDILKNIITTYHKSMDFLNEKEGNQTINIK